MNTSVPVLDQPVSIKRIEVRRLLLPLAEPLRSSHGLVSDRDIVVVRIDTDDGPGWGECSALPEPTYTDEFAAGAFAVISEELAPRLVRRELSVTDLRRKTSMFPGNPMAKASLEMALLDVVLTSRSMALATWLQASKDRLPAGATVGVSSPSQLAERVQALVSSGYRRVKIKISSAAELDAVADLTQAHPGVRFQIDPNGSCEPDDISRLVELSNSLDAIEQPFPPEHIELARQLVAQVDIPIIADEPIDSVDAAERLVTAKACSALAVKPPRLGGILSALELHRAASTWGAALSIGGMIECGLGRHSLAAVASLDGFSVDGDLSPARRWIDTDPWPDLGMETIDGAAHVIVPAGPGVAPPPDLEILKSVTTGTALVT